MLAELTCLASKSERRTTKVRVTTGEMSVDARAAEVVDVDEIRTQSRCLRRLRNL
jgi:hypothetical protein